MNMNDQPVHAGFQDDDDIEVAVPIEDSPGVLDFGEPVARIEKTADIHATQPAQPAPQWPAVMAEVAAIQNKKKGWVHFLAILAVSMGMFLLVEYNRAHSSGLPMTSDAVLHSLYFIMPILLFHELGHFIAMKLFGYKNLQMFFIPAFGAAVTGQRYGLAGWKKAIVYLMGPVPGILLGCGLAVPALVYNHPVLLEAAIMLVIINGFNLIPILPMDGGHVMQLLLFSRTPKMDFVFRAVAAILFLLFGVYIGGNVTIGAAVFMIIALPFQWKLGKMASALKKDPYFSPPGDDEGLHLPLLNAIIALIKGDTSMAKLKDKQVAVHSLAVYEKVTARAPGWSATLGLFFVYGGSLMLGVVISLVLVTSKLTGGVKGFMAAVKNHASTPLALTDIRISYGGGVEADLNASPDLPKTIISNFKSVAETNKAFEELRTKLAPGESLMQFGQTLLCSVPDEDASAKKRWFSELDKRTKSTYASDSNMTSFRMTAFAPSEGTAKEIAQEMERSCNAIPDYFYLTAPWDPTLQKTPAEGAKHRIARNTYQLLCNLKWMDDPRLKGMFKEIEEALRQGDRDELKRIQEGQFKLRESIRMEAYDKLRGITDGSVDQALVEKFIELEKARSKLTVDFNSTEEMEEGAPKRSAVPAEKDMAPMMGQLPLVKSVPTAGARRYSAMFGNTSSNGSLVTINSMHFVHPPDGVRALVAWLEKQKCKQMQYNFFTYSGNDFGE